MIRKTPSGAVGYAQSAERLFERYQSQEFDSVHRSVRDYFPVVPSTILDIGAGSGRDAAYLAGLGHTVTAVEPTREFLNLAREFHRGVDIEWLSDQLPDLVTLIQLERTFDLILLSAVWMHLDAQERVIAMRNLATLTHEGSFIIMSLRHGPSPAMRKMYDVSAAETTALARSNGFLTLAETVTESVQDQNRRQKILWSRLVFKKS